MESDHPINIAGIDHVVLRVDNLDQMVEFYQTVLGCRLERGPGENRLAQLRAGRSLIDLVEASGPIGEAAGQPAHRNAPNMDHVCLKVVPWDADAVLEHLERHAVEFGELESRYGATGNGPSVYLKDPEGNTVELKGD